MSFARHVIDGLSLHRLACSSAMWGGPLVLSQMHPAPLQRWAMESRANPRPPVLLGVLAGNLQLHSIEEYHRRFSVSPIGVLLNWAPQLTCHTARWRILRRPWSQRSRRLRLSQGLLLGLEAGRVHLDQCLSHLMLHRSHDPLSHH
eukprot:CAMPEP_0181483836 /NCGR_PEP_ID=MMETSP1110-20121109/45650_1 /TAXON_ID=174948 /ORGANISM="Symbiodinium sp., Strain CCMP421" /LENGTH=145 /DNA_ID=CAMNT_0023609607 /DNA_START=62 /DNA_END=496 /DNA_ORIENTATION=+